MESIEKTIVLLPEKRPELVSALAWLKQQRNMRRRGASKTRKSDVRNAAENAISRLGRIKKDRRGNKFRHYPPCMSVESVKTGITKWRNFIAEEKV